MSASAFPPIQVELPSWIADAVPTAGEVFASLEDRMRFVVALSELNVARKTGGPFGAAVFNEATGALLAPGVNLVVASRCSMAHAEMVALAISQRMVGCHDLGEKIPPAFQLVSSTEPCAMCMGAIPWSGVTSLVCGARDEDARSAGFDEGIKAETWEESFRTRGIQVYRDVLRDRAARVLRDYAERGGIVYNGRAAARERHP